MGFEEYRRKQGAGRSTRWTAITKHVDLDTGEVITKYKAETEYIKIKTERHVKRTTTAGQIEYVIGYRKSTQGNLFNSNA